MNNTNQLDPRIVHAKHFLSAHFGQTLRIRFFADAYPLRPSEVFDDLMALAPIAVSADMASVSIYGRPLVEERKEDPESAFGFVARLRPDIESVDLFLLVAAAEEFFGISADSHSPQEGADVDLARIFERMQQPAVEEKQ